MSVLPYVQTSVFVDSRWFTVDQCGDITGPMTSGALGRNAIAADLFDLCAARHPGRQHHNEITIFKNGGGAHLDLMTARFAHERVTGSGKSAKAAD